ncbi:MAG: M14 family metallopeptidase [Oligoflexales bacterium]
MGNIKFFLLLFTLPICLLIKPIEQLSGTSEYVVIDAPLTTLPELKKNFNDFDFLGADFLKGRAQARIPAQDYHDIIRKYDNIILVTGSSLISANIEGYTSPDQVLDVLYQLELEHPDFVEGFEVGLSTEGRSIRGIILSSPTEENSISNKPSILFNAMHHARELMTTEVILDIADYLLSNYEQDEIIQTWLDRYRIILVPQVNPDGNQRVHEGNRWWRKNTWLSRNRVTGVDLNRNYPTLWDGCGGSSGNKGSQDYRGPSPASEPETQAMMELVAKHKPVLNVSYHSYSELIIYPYGCRKESNPSRQIFHEIALDMKKTIIDDNDEADTYQVGTAPELLYQADGTDLDYQWQKHNVIAYTIEINSRATGFQPSYQEWRDITVERQRGSWKTLLDRMSGGGVTAQTNSNDEVTYKLSKADSQGAVNWDEGIWSKTMSPRSTTLIFELLSSGSYTLVATNKDKQKIVKNFRIENKILDLGLLDFNN